MKRRRPQGARALSRRRLLTGLGGVAVGLPWLERLDGVARAQSAVSGPKRVIVVTYPMGVPLGAWRPSAAGSTFTLPYVTEPLAPFQDRCLFVSCLDHPMLAMGGDAFVWGHPGKQEASLTGTLTTGAFPTTNDNHVDEIRSDATTDGGANGPSVEHLIGVALRDGQPYASVDLAVDGYAALATYGPPQATYASNFFFQGRGNAITLNAHPSQAFSTLFAGIGEDEPSEADVALRQLRERNKSVLDAVRDSFDELKQGLGTEDRRRLEEHAALIRQLEVDIQVSEGCTVPTGLDGVSDYSGYSMDQLAPLQRRILTHAMACNLAPIGRLEFVNQQNPRFGIPALDQALDDAGAMYDWHAMVHGDPLPGTTAFLRPGRGEVPIRPPPRPANAALRGQDRPFSGPVPPFPGSHRGFRAVRG
jgi:hypothetical protein